MGLLVLAKTIKEIILRRRAKYLLLLRVKLEKKLSKLLSHHPGTSSHHNGVSSGDSTKSRRLQQRQRRKRCHPE